MPENKSKNPRKPRKSKSTTKRKPAATKKTKVEWQGLPPEPLTKEEKDWVDNNLTAKFDKITHTQRRKISEIHARTFRHKFSVPCACKSNIKLYTQWIQELLKLSSAQ